MAEFDLDASFIPALHKPPALLPIAKHRDALLYLIETNHVTIVVGQTGSGKTTQIPQFLERAGWCAEGKIIAVTQVTKSLSPPSKDLPLIPCSHAAWRRRRWPFELQRNMDARSGRK